MIKKLLQDIFIFFGYKLINLKKDKSNLEQYYKEIIDIPNPIIFDVGANKGQSIEKFKNYYKDCILHSFEPNINLKSDLEKIISNHKNVKLNFFGLGDKVEKKEFFKYKMHRFNSFNKIDTEKIWLNERAKTINSSAADLFLNNELAPIDTIDNYCNKNKIDKIDILKIDTQGYEKNVIEGAIEMIKNNKVDLIELELIFTEVYNETNIYDIEKFLIPNNYKLFGNNTYGNLFSDYFWQTEHVYISKKKYEKIKIDKRFKSFSKS